jgi:hypothetical protein
MEFNKQFEDFYNACVDLVGELVKLDPPADSPEGKLLTGMATAVEEYETNFKEGLSPDENNRSDEED